MTQNKHALKHPRVPDPQRAAKARRGSLLSQMKNAARIEAEQVAADKAAAKQASADKAKSLAEAAAKWDIRVYAAHKTKAAS